MFTKVKAIKICRSQVKPLVVRGNSLGSFLTIVVPLYPWGMFPDPPHGCLKAQKVANFFLYIPIIKLNYK